MMSKKPSLLNFDSASLEAHLADIGERPFRAQQILKWVYHKGVLDFDKMTDLGQSLRTILKKTVSVQLPEIIAHQQSSDGTQKWLLRLDGFNSIETVFIPTEGRGTLCVSSQVGCPLDCRFCATAQQGFNRNLTAGEIISQVWIANHVLGHFRTGKKVISNIVFMGMGEPLLNYDNVLKSTRLLTGDGGFGLAKRKVTISTSGIVPQIDKLKDDSDVSLAISLHASNDDLRSQMIPINRTYPLHVLLGACQRFSKARDHEPITIEYVMLKGVNDSNHDARTLLQCLHQLPAKINLIPFNSFPGADYLCSDSETIDAFKNVLMRSGVVTTIRRTRGNDINAACGQLAGHVVAKSIRHRKNQNTRAHHAN